MNKSITFQIAFIVSFFLFQSSVSISQPNLDKKVVSASFEVLGNCEMCKKKIEGAVLKLKGIKKVNWSQENLLLSVKFNSARVQLVEIKQAIAKAGYDTDNFKASDEAYNNLHYCCKYDRKL
jgi:copper chaperone CopZ